VRVIYQWTMPNIIPLHKKCQGLAEHCLGTSVLFAVPYAWRLLCGIICDQQIKVLLNLRHPSRGQTIRKLDGLAFIFRSQQ
jgi:hypothetical protein